MTFLSFASLILFAVFIVAVVGCGSGFVPLPMAVHGETGMCANMLVDDLVLTQREGGLALLIILLLGAQFLVFAFKVYLLADFAKLRYLVLGALIRQYEGAEKLRDIIIQAFSSGVLQPKVY